MRIARRLQWVAALSLVFILASAAVAIMALDNVQRQQRAIVDHQLPVAFALNDLNQGARQVISSANEYALLKQIDASPTELAIEHTSMVEGQQLMRDAARRYAEASTGQGADQDLKVAGVRSTSEEIAAEGDRYLAVADAPASLTRDVLSARQAFERAEVAFSTVVDLADATSDANVKAAAATAETATLLGISAVAVATTALAALALTLSWGLWRATVPPLRSLAAFSSRIGRHELEARTGIERDDEIGELANAMDAMAHDLTVSLAENEASRARVAQSERLASLGTLVAGVAHEINNPLAYIRGNIELMQMESTDMLSTCPEAEPRVEALLAQSQTALKGIDRIASITKSLKLIARTSGKVRRAEDLNAITESVVNVASARFSDTVLVNVELHSKQRVLANGSQLAQVLINLLFNAADATRAKGSAVTVRTFDESGMVVLEIEDDGPGIPPDVQARIFTPFFTTKQDGTGLGLSLSHSIAVDHAGSLAFHSTSAGTTFRLEIPAMARPEIVA